MIYRFEEFELDPERPEIRRQDSPIDVEPQVFDLLRCLIECRERVVSKDELLEQVWGGRIVSESTLSSRINAARRVLDDDGKQQGLIRTYHRRGFRFVGSVNASAVDAMTVGNLDLRSDDNEATPAQPQKVRFCKSRDGTQIAFANIGTGYPLVRAGHWLTHLEHDWQSPVWRPILNELGRTFSVWRYDQRGNGLSDWSVEDFSLSEFVDDLEAVVDAADLELFALYGTSQGAPIAIEYATRHPDRVCHLVLHGGYVQGRLIREAAKDREQGEALITLMRHGWGQAASPFIKAFASRFILDGSREQTDYLAELQKLTTSPENAVRLRTAVDKFDVSHLLQIVTSPTLVLHASNDGVHPLDQGRKLTAGITNAEFILLQSSNHVILEQESAWQTLFGALRNFILGNG